MQLQKKTPLMLQVEEKLGEDLKKFFDIEYTTRGLTMRQLTEKIRKLTGHNVLPGVLSRWFKILGIPARKLRWEVSNGSGIGSSTSSD